MAQSKEKKARAHRVDVRFSDDEFQHLNLVRDGDTRSEFIRKLIFNKRAMPKDPELKEIRRELSRIGTNLNQIARHCNTHKVSPSTAALIAEVEELECQLVSLAGKI